MDKEGMKTVLKAALEIGHRYTGKSRKEFATEVRPYLELASKFAEKVNVDYLLKVHKIFERRWETSESQIILNFPAFS